MRERIEACVLIGDPGYDDAVDLMFGPLEPGETVMRTDTVTRWEELLVAYGIFPSNSQARKNGHGGEIPWGYSEIVVGKLNSKFSVWRVTPNGESAWDLNERDGIDWPVPAGWVRLH